MEMNLPFGIPDYKPIEDDPRAYMDWVTHTQPCLVSKRLMSDPHHVRSKGAGGKERDNIAPLQRRWHTELHQIGKKAFEKKYGINLKVEAERITRVYEERA